MILLHLQILLLLLQTYVARVDGHRVDESISNKKGNDFK